MELFIGMSSLYSKDYQKKKDEVEEKHQYGLNLKKNKITEYRLHENYERKLKHRFLDLKKKIEQELKVYDTNPRIWKSLSSNAKPPAISSSKKKFSTKITFVLTVTTNTDLMIVKKSKTFSK